jgi:hypothetical protein
MHGDNSGNFYNNINENMATVGFGDNVHESNSMTLATSRKSPSPRSS